MRAQYRQDIQLFPREKAVLELMAAELKRGQIATQLGISPNRAGKYYQQAKDKLCPAGETWTKEQVIARAKEHRLI